MTLCKSDQFSEIGITENTPVIYESGQRRCGPPENWSDSLPEKGCEIFIAKIPKNYFEKDLIPIFREIGDIYTFRLMMDTETSHRGFGFCLYTKHATAKRAVSKLNNYQIKKNWYLGVCFSVDNCRLFVGGIPKLKSKLEIRQEMSNFTDNIVDIIVYPSAADKHKNRGFAFVEYTNHMAAAIARKKMISNNIQLWGHTVAVDWAEPERKVEDEIMSKVRILYVRNLMLTTSEETIYRVFSQYIDDPQEIIKVKKIEDFAFVHFKSRDKAEIVRNLTNGMDFEGSKIEVHFAKPVNKIEQQQKLFKKSTILDQTIPLLLTTDLNRLSLSSNGTILSNSEIHETNGLNVNKSYRNAAGRCSMKSKQMMKNMENSDDLYKNYTNLLAHICQKYGWGLPFYTIQLIPVIFSNDCPNNGFMAQVYIPGLNFHFPSKTVAFTQEEAILQSCETALIWLSCNGIYIPFLLGNSKKNYQTEKLSKSFFESEIKSSSLKNFNPTDTLVNNNTIQTTYPNIFIPQIFHYNTCYPVCPNNSDASINFKTSIETKELIQINPNQKNF